MIRISWTDRAVHRTKGERYIVCKIQQMKANLIGYMLRKNWLLNHVFDGKTEGGIGVKRR